MTKYITYFELIIRDPICDYCGEVNGEERIRDLHYHDADPEILDIWFECQKCNLMFEKKNNEEQGR